MEIRTPYYAQIKAINSEFLDTGTIKWLNKCSPEDFVVVTCGNKEGVFGIKRGLVYSIDTLFEMFKLGDVALMHVRGIAYNRCIDRGFATSKSKYTDYVYVVVV